MICSSSSVNWITTPLRFSSSVRVADSHLHSQAERTLPPMRLLIIRLTCNDASGELSKDRGVMTRSSLMDTHPA